VTGLVVVRAADLRTTAPGRRRTRRAPARDEGRGGGRTDGDELRQLVHRAQHHDEEAWERLYRSAYPRMLAYARRRAATAEAADDAVSEAMARAVAKIGGYRWTGAGFDAWLFGILRLVLLEGHRAERRDVRLRRRVGAQPQDGGEDAAAPVLVADEAARLRAALDRLRPADREVLELRLVAGLDAAAVGEVLGKGAGAVRMAQSRAVDRLRAALEDPA
jgi:RNA polymerase sigma-70 factor, ECF subfamily